MKKKKHITNRKTRTSVKPPNYCNHCGGAVKFSQDDISCLMCGRSANHFCDNCIVAQDLARKRA